MRLHKYYQLQTEPRPQCSRRPLVFRGRATAGSSFQGSPKENSQDRPHGFPWLLKQGKRGNMPRVAPFGPDTSTTAITSDTSTLDRTTRPQPYADRRQPLVSDLPEKRRREHDSSRQRRFKKVDQRQARVEDADKRQCINWPVVFWIGLLHVGALAAPFFFSWQAVVLVFALHWLTGGIGICLGFHRLITHGSFQTWQPVKWLIGVIGGLAGEGSVIDWVANHRKHHAHSDQADDPHSPHDGGWWSHILWLFFMSSGEAHQKHVERWAPDLVKDPVMRSVSAWFLPSNI